MILSKIVHNYNRRRDRNNYIMNYNKESNQIRIERLGTMLAFAQM